MSAAGAMLLVNPNQAVADRLGIALALPAGQKFKAGTNQIVRVSFLVNNNATVSSTRIDFGRQPLVGEVADVNATPA